MATAVLDVDVENRIGGFSGLEKYTRALFLVRMRATPVAKVIVPVVNGRVNGTELREAIVRAIPRAFGEQALRDFLGVSGDVSPGFVPPRATVAVITGDRTEDLRRCLEGLIRLPDDGQELMVI